MLLRLGTLAYRFNFRKLSCFLSIHLYQIFLKSVLLEGALLRSRACRKKGRDPSVRESRRLDFAEQIRRLLTSDLPYPAFIRAGPALPLSTPSLFSFLSC